MSTISAEARRRIMQGNKGKNTKPEIMVRKMLHAKGYRFRLHRKDLPGKPDIVLPKLRLAIFIHGCFWHQHEQCKLSSTPKTNIDFWKEKFKRNKDRDQKNKKELEERGWRVEKIWECETKNIDTLSDIIDEIISNSRESTNHTEK